MRARKLTIWRVFEHLLHLLAKENLNTWNTLCYQAAQATGPVYDQVIADEVQDFGLAELRFVRALAAPGKNDILLCGIPPANLQIANVSPELRAGCARPFHAIEDQPPNDAADPAICRCPVCSLGG